MRSLLGLLASDLWLGGGSAYGAAHAPAPLRRRAIHTNLKAAFKCDALLLAMIKTERLAKHLFGESGALYDCVCKVRRAGRVTLGPAGPPPPTRMPMGCWQGATPHILHPFAVAVAC